MSKKRNTYMRSVYLCVPSKHGEQHHRVLSITCMTPTQVGSLFPEKNSWWSHHQPWRGSLKPVPRPNLLILHSAKRRVSEQPQGNKEVTGSWEQIPVRKPTGTYMASPISELLKSSRLSNSRHLCTLLQSTYFSLIFQVGERDNSKKGNNSPP